MGQIAILDDNTINKIAAGEVVDRPASIVKELVENSIDAGATAINVEIKNGGISYINITDNGGGIASDDVRIAFERHATSKIRQEADILKIMSMGFRGEALASIASIAKVTLKTKKADEYTGTIYEICGGIEKDFSEIAWDKGTSITVQDVFFNTPARFKFLKKDSTEAGYIEDAITRLSLAHPNVAFKLISNGKKILSTTGNSDLNTAVYNIFGREYYEELQSVNAQTDGIKVTGVIGSPKLSRSSRQFEFTYINSRYVKDKTISAAIERAFEQNLNIGKFPFAILNIELDPSKVDVNVHPSKLEVKFENENKIFEAVYYAVKSAIDVYHKQISPFTKNLEEENEEKKESTNLKNTEYILKVSEEKKDSYEGAKEEVAQEKVLAVENLAFNGNESTANVVLDNDLNENIAVTNDTKSSFSPIYYEEKKDNIDIKEAVTIMQNMAIAEAEKFETEVKYRYIGQLFNTYILIEIKDKLYIIDQHAAHERLLYEDFKAKYDAKEKQTQMLLIPTLVELKNSEKQMLLENIAMFEKAGFELEEFGDNAIKISGVPNVGFDIHYEEMFKDILDEISGSVKTATEEKEKRFVYTLACKAAIKANMPQTREEHIALIDKMVKLDRPFTCPHGRPTAYEISKYEIERRFARK